MILFHCQLEISSYFLLDDISRVDRCAGDVFLLFESNGTSVAEAGLNIIEILKIQSWFVFPSTCVVAVSDLFLTFYLGAYFTFYVHQRGEGP